MRSTIVFFDNVASLIEQARKHVGRTANLTMCVTYFEIGRMIVEEEQEGEARAKYGPGLVADLSIFLEKRFGKGFSETNLRYARKFYLIYSPSIQQTMFAEFIDSAHSIKNQTQPRSNNRISQTIFVESISQRDPVKHKALSEFFKVSWSHYLILMRIRNDQERCFYEIESANNSWSLEELKRQYHSSLYERLALSRDKAEVMRLAKEGQKVERPRDILKPVVLDFLGIESGASYSETDLESAIISKLQKFLLKLGKGFLFEARQKRFSFDKQSFFVDLVLYNRLLQCYVIIDLKTVELKHQDLGQMLMYVNFFDRHVRADHEKPTIGILLCREKNDSIVELTLPEDSNIYASEYSLYLPDKTILQQKLAEWIEEFEEERSNDK